MPMPNHKRVFIHVLILVTLSQVVLACGNQFRAHRYLTFYLDAKSSGSSALQVSAVMSPYSSDYGCSQIVVQSDLDVEPGSTASIKLSNTCYYVPQTSVSVRIGTNRVSGFVASSQYFNFTKHEGTGVEKVECDDVTCSSSIGPATVADHR